MFNKKIAQLRTEAATLAKQADALESLSSIPEQEPYLVHFNSGRVCLTYKAGSIKNAFELFELFDSKTDVADQWWCRNGWLTLSDILDVGGSYESLSEDTWQSAHRYKLGGKVTARTGGRFNENEIRFTCHTGGQILNVRVQISKNDMLADVSTYCENPRAQPQNRRHVFEGVTWDSELPFNDYIRRQYSSEEVPWVELFIH